MNKKAQISIWVIIAIVLVASIMLYFFVNRPGIMTKEESFNPRPIIERCAKDAVNEAVDKMLPLGGFLKPVNFRWWNYTNISVHCYDSGYFAKCVPQHPMLLTEMRNEIFGYVKPRIESCFETVRAGAADKGWEISFGEMSMDVQLAPDRVIVNMSRETRMKKAETTETLKDYGAEVMNPVYNLGVVAMEIANAEARLCTFNSVEYMKLYPRFNIRNTITSDSTKIYFIRDTKSAKEMRIATRSCAMPYV